MNIFDLRDAVVGDYRDYVKGFINIQDGRIREIVEGAVDAGLLSPDPIVQLNPSYEPGEPLAALVKEGILDPACAEIFVDKNGVPLRLYKHQTDAIRRAVKGEDYVLTTGTGSGKSLTYIIPIVNHILRQGSGQGVQAIIVYPMNALANSQIGELEKFLPEEGAFSDRIKFERYTGQESLEKKNAIRENPPDVILTNYMMLELILTRASEKALVQKLANLKFFVLDELHSYRGRQGADVAMLARRTLDAAVGAETDKVVCVGTSATIASGKSREDDRREVARVAGQIFGKSFLPENIVGETLRRETDEIDFNEPEERDALRREIDAFSQPDADEKTLQTFFGAADALVAIRSSKLASWIETQFGTQKDETTGELVRQSPKKIAGDAGVARELANLVDRDAATCVQALKFLFLRGADVKTETGRSFFPFKLHQFIGRGENAYATAELAENRRIFMSKQVYAPGSDRKAKLYPLVFCANCGQEFYSVERVVERQDKTSPEKIRFDAREPFDSLALDQIEKENAGYLLVLKDQTATKEEIEKDLLKRLPEEWFDDDSVKKGRKKDVPVYYRVNKLGEVVPESDDEAVNVLFVPTPFRFCPDCNVAYPPDTSARTVASDSSHLSNLSAGGRSSATTLLALATENQLLEFFADDEEESRKKRKFLSFTDNRQDASLQAGHFNDFVKVVSLRAALYKALQAAGNVGLCYDDVVEKVVETLDVEFTDLEREGREFPEGTARANVLNAFKKVVRYQILRDLRRGWRFLVPNLEQTGLLKIEFDELASHAQNDSLWRETHDALKRTSPEKRLEILDTLLYRLREELALDADELNVGKQKSFVESVQGLIAPKWGFDSCENEQSLVHSKTAYPFSEGTLRETVGGRKISKIDNVCVSKDGGFGSYLLRTLRNDADVRIDRKELTNIISDLFALCHRVGILNKTDEKRGGYRISPYSLRWKIADQKIQPVDRIRQYGQTETAAPVNEYFRALYQSESALNARIFFAREHTAQVAPDEREKREEMFKIGALPILFCSPTMELGVDISELNVVHMRNIPPTPANYAQRSGRAGRSGQPALSLVYSTPLSQHDRYYFKRPEKVVSGAVAPPQIDLRNEALLRSHLYAIWLAEAVKLEDFQLGDQMIDIVDAPDLDLNGKFGNVPQEKRVCAVNPEKLEYFKNTSVKKSAAARAKRVLLPLFKESQPGSNWLNEEWVDQTLDRVETEFKTACERWMNLYNVALKQYDKQYRDAISHQLDAKQKKEARRLANQAKNEIELLTNASKSFGEKSEFYPYRYFAAEGFLPGYNFPRLPVYAYLPAIRSDRDEEYLSRSRFLAISEFGPKAIVYHEGARYRIVRALIAPSDLDAAATSDPTIPAMICANCGYYHDASEPVDLCENCGAELTAVTDNLLELQKATAQRATRITCDEEERLRFGYAVTTSYRFATRDGVTDATKAEIVLPGGEIWGEFVYGDAATIYRVNNGLKRQKKEERKGFKIDLSIGRWIKDADDDYDETENKPLRHEDLRFVRPFVRDVKNCVVIKPKEELDPASFASFQAALQRAIERVFSIDDRELGAFPLPDEDERRELLLYEAAEGGAGALKQLQDKEKFNEVLREAFAVCHYDLKMNQDIKDGPNAAKDCDAACYDCLLSYSNQRDHEIIDRRLAIEVFKKLLGATLDVSSNATQSRGELLQSLKDKCESELEKEWLEFVDANHWRLPNEAQKTFSFSTTRPDFFYSLDGEKLAVYVDGPKHDDFQRKQDDEKFRKELRDEHDVAVAVFRYDERGQWSATAQKFGRFFFLE